MNETRTAPTQVMADLLGIPYKPPVAITDCLTTAGIIRNGGIRFPGQEGMSASKGSSKPKATKPVKESAQGTWDDTKTFEENIGIDPTKKITKGRVVSEGLYRYGDTQARVKVSQTSGKPYALVLVNGNWEYTPGVFKLLKASDRIEDTKPVAPKLAEGFYRYGAGCAEVVRTKDGQRLYAKVLDVHTGRWNYVAGAMSHIKAEDRLTLAQAAELGKKWHRCMICGRELTNPESIDRGIGPICMDKL